MEKTESTEKSIPDKLYYKIGEVSEITGIEPYVLRYWESEFKIINPIRTKSRQRLYRKRDLELIMEIKHLLHDERFTIEGARKKLQKSGRGKPKQLDFGFKDKEYHEILFHLKEELEEIRALLE
jgi:DNA-binding transcriptional MerR regulator